MALSEAQHIIDPPVWRSPQFLQSEKPTKTNCNYLFKITRSLTILWTTHFLFLPTSTSTCLYPTYLVYPAPFHVQRSSTTAATPKTTLLLRSTVSTLLCNSDHSHHQLRPVTSACGVSYGVPNRITGADQEGILHAIDLPITILSHAPVRSVADPVPTFSRPLVLIPGSILDQCSRPSPRPSSPSEPCRRTRHQRPKTSSSSGRRGP